MRRASVILVFVICLGFCGDTSPVGPKTVEFVRSDPAYRQYFAFHAHQTATGEVSGYIVSRSTPDYSAPFVIEGSVNCLRVVGRRATIGGELHQYYQEDMPEVSQYRGWLLYVEDNRDRPGLLDRISKYIWGFNAPTTYCPDPDGNSADVDRDDGDVIVSSNQ